MLTNTGGKNADRQNKRLLQSCQQCYTNNYRRQYRKNYLIYKANTDALFYKCEIKQ